MTEDLKATVSTLESRLQEAEKKLADERAGRARIIEGFEFRERDLEHRLQEAERRAEECVRAFAAAILHGDDDHRKWLVEAADAFTAGKPLPAPYGLGRMESAERQLAEVRAAYNELLYAVVKVWPGETRHETALRYIREAEKIDTACDKACAAIIEKEKGDA